MALRFSESDMNKSIMAATGMNPLLINRKSGLTLFVDAEDGNDSRSGDRADRPLLTIQEAVDRATTKKQTNILVLESGTDFAENIVVNAKRDINIIAVTKSGNRITNSPATGIPLRVHGVSHNFSVYGMQFNAQDGSDAVRQQSSRFKYSFCDLLSATGIAMHLLPDLDDDSDSASEGFIEDTWMRLSDIGIQYKNPGPGVEGGIGTTGVMVRRALFSGNTNQDVKDVDTAGSNDSVFGSTTTEPNWILDSHFATLNKTAYITLSAGGNNHGLIAGCFFANDNGLTGGTKIALATGITAAGNFNAVGVVDLSSL